MRKTFALATAVACCLLQSLNAQAADVSLAVGTSNEGNMVYRVGAGFAWDKNWWESSTGRLTGYWDAGYTYWHGGDEDSSEHSLSFAPVFVYEFSTGSVQPFIEAGIGAGLFSSTRVSGQDLGSALHFEDRLGFGLKFAGGHTIGVRALHYSNAGLEQPNEGIESYSLYYSLPL
ncbi:Lipid A deacylase PagL precursor [compost metagenome]